MTADEYCAIGETAERTELIDGVVVMSPSPQPRHQQVVQRVFRQLDAYADAIGGMVFLDTDVRLASSHVYRPDVVAYAAGKLISIPDRLTSPPDLAIEVLSAGTAAYDLITKRDDYERFGVGEYWVVDPRTAAVRCWKRQGSRLVEVVPEGDSVASASLPGFVMDMRPIRAVAGE
jgi:Uma2 family endonuclease